MTLKKIVSCVALCSLPLSGGFAKDAEGDRTHGEFKSKLMAKAGELQGEAGDFEAFCYHSKIDDELTNEPNKLASPVRESKLVLIEYKELGEDDPFYSIKVNDLNSLGKVIYYMEQQNPDYYGCSIGSKQDYSDPYYYCLDENVSENSQTYIMMMNRYDFFETYSFNVLVIDNELNSLTKEKSCFSARVADLKPDVPKQRWWHKLFCKIGLCGAN